MATKNTIRRTVISDNYMECSICMDAFKQPKCLPCIHTFCLECLKTFGKDEHPGDEMECPLCRQIFLIPRGGFEKLPRNFYITEILEESETLPSLVAVREPNCDGCTKAVAAKYCLNCTQNMCNECSVPHGKLKGTSWHKVVLLEEKEGSVAYMNARSSYCDKHADRQLEQYCINCNDVICLMCLAIEHDGHSHMDVNESSNLFIDKLRDGFPELNSCIVATKDEMKHLTKERNKFRQQVAAKVCAIAERCNVLKSLIDAQGNALTEQLSNFENEGLKCMQTRREEVENHLAVMESFKICTVELTSKGSACDVSRNAADLLNRTKQLVVSHDELKRGKLLPVDISFTKAQTPESFNCALTLIGKLTLKGLTPKPKEQEDVQPSHSAGPLLTNSTAESKELLSTERAVKASRCETTKEVEQQSQLSSQHSNSKPSSKPWSVTSGEPKCELRLKRREVLSHNQRKVLSRNLPARALGAPWTLLYSTDQHGFSLRNLYRSMGDVDSSVLLVISDANKIVFGALLSCPLKITEGFVGSGESYLFTFKSGFKKFGWSGDNHFVFKGCIDSLSIGSSCGKFGLWVDGDLNHGRTQQCTTFDNDLLTLKEDFVIHYVEVWSFSHCAH